MVRPYPPKYPSSGETDREREVGSKASEMGCGRDPKGRPKKRAGS
jgi:hypothetical protein